MSDLRKLFQEGGQGDVIATQALDQLKLFQDSGFMSAEVADGHRRSLEESALFLKQSGGKETGGFLKQAQIIGDIGSDYNAWAKGEETIKRNSADAANRLKAVANLYEQGGGKLTKERQDAITSASNLIDGKGDVAYMNALAKQIETEDKVILENKNKPKTKEQIEAGTLKFNDIDKFDNLAEMKGYTESQKLDPSIRENLISEVAQRKINSIEARRAFVRMNAAQELLKDPELMGEFGDPLAVNFFQAGAGGKIAGDHAKHAALLQQISGGSLGEGMRVVKETTGTAAQMSERETGAFQAAVSPLNADVAPEDAKVMLDEVVAASSSFLDSLGVDPELYEVGSDGQSRVRDVLSNKEKYLFADERAFQKLKNPIPADKMTPAQARDAEAETNRGILEGAP